MLKAQRKVSGAVAIRFHLAHQTQVSQAGDMLKLRLRLGRSVELPVGRGRDAGRGQRPPVGLFRLPPHPPDRARCAGGRCRRESAGSSRWTRTEHAGPIAGASVIASSRDWREDIRAGNRPMTPTTAIVPIKRALLSVFDKTGMEEFAKELARAGGRSGVDRRHEQADRGDGRRGARHLRSHRLSRNDGRAGQDAASQGAWRAARGARQPRPQGVDGRASRSARSIWSWSTSIRSRRPSPRAPPMTRPSRTSISAARR